MNTLQYVAALRALIMVAGGIAVGRGWVTAADLAALSDPATLTAILGGLAALGALASGIYSRRTKQMVDDTAKLPEVKAVVTSNKLAADIPADNVVATAAQAQRMGI